MNDMHITLTQKVSQSKKVWAIWFVFWGLTAQTQEQSNIHDNLADSEMLNDYTSDLQQEKKQLISEIEGSYSIEHAPDTLLSIAIVPLAENVYLGDDIVLTATIARGSVIEYIWTTPNRGTITTTSNVLNLPHATLEDEGNYNVVAVDINGYLSDSSNDVSINVVSELTVSLVTKCNVVTPCSSITFKATAHGGVPPYEYMWQDNLSMVDVTGSVTRTFDGNQPINITVIDSIGNRATAKANTCLAQSIKRKYCS